MQELWDETETELEDGQPIPKIDIADPLEMVEIYTSDEAVSPGEDWEIAVTTEMKRKMAGPWQTSIILKLTGRQLGYRALQTRLAGIWRLAGHREVNCPEQLIVITHMNPPGLEPHGKPEVPELEKNHSPWKTVQTRRSNMRGRINNTQTRGKFNQQNAYTPSKPREIALSTDPLVMSPPHAIAMTSQMSKGKTKRVGYHRTDVARQGENSFLLLSSEPEEDYMQESHANSCPRLAQMARSSDQNSSAPTPIDPDLHFTPSPQSYLNIHIPHSMSTHSATPQDQAQQMELLEQIWSGLSLGRSDDETVNYVRIPVHPRAALVWNQVTQTPSLPMRLEPPPQTNLYRRPCTHTRVCQITHPYQHPERHHKIPSVRQRNARMSYSSLSSPEQLPEAIF
nr:hypothetical protein CFP56_07010 [Quercus suber]